MSRVFRRIVVTSFLLVVPAQGLLANNYGESMAWQFETTADKVNLAIIQDMIQKKKHGMYAAPIYTTNIDKQFNCNVTSSAVGNNATNSNVANSPSTSGATSKAVGNNNSTDVSTSVPGGSSSATGSQTNSGQVGSSVTGGTSTDVRGKAWQALNNTQTNSGNQSASVSGSTGCTFGTLN